MSRDRDSLAAFAPRGDVLASVHDRARAAAAAARIGADAELRAAVAAADVTPPPRASDRVEHGSVAVRPGGDAPRITASKVKIHPDAVAIELPPGRVDDETIAPHRAARPGGERMAEPITTPGLGGAPGGAPSGGVDGSTRLEPAVSRAEVDGESAGEPGAPAATVDEAMREAELKIAEQQSREVFEREKRRRIVDEQTRGKLGKVEKGSKEHFEVLALRQKWTLPLDDADYKLWMQQHLLAEHGGALAEQATQLRIETAKRVARGPLIAIAAVALLGAVAALGWWVRGGDVPPDTAATSAQSRAPAATSVVTAAPAPTGEPARSGPVVAPAGTDAPAPSVTPAAAPEAAAPAETTTAPAAAPATGKPGSTAPATAPAGPRAPAPGGKKDIWEREF